MSALSLLTCLTAAGCTKLGHILNTSTEAKMAPRMAAVLRAPGKLCSFPYVLFFLLFYVLDVVSITVYDRDTLLNIGSSVAQRKPDLFFILFFALSTERT